MAARPTKITFGEMREFGVRGVLIYCCDYRCSHGTAISADRWPDEQPSDGAQADQDFGELIHHRRGGRGSGDL